MTTRSTIWPATASSAWELLLRFDAIAMNGTRNTEHHGGYNPLGCAVNMRSLKGVTWFLDHGCDPNEVQSKREETALHVAVNSGAGVRWCACWCSAASTLPARRRSTNRPRLGPRQAQDHGRVPESFAD